LHEKRDFQYLYAFMGYDDGLSGRDIDLTLSNLHTGCEIKNGIQLRTQYDTESYVLTQAEAPSLGTSYIFQNQTDIPDQGNFESSALWPDSSGAGLGRFSKAPRNQVAYTNGVESCVWAGEEMPVGGFYTFEPITVTSAAGAADFSQVTEQMGANAVDFQGYGFLPGMVVDVSGTTSNDKTFQISAVSTSGSYSQVLTCTGSPAMVTENNATATFTASPGYSGYSNAVDWTDAALNSLSTSGNVVTIGSGIDSDTLLMLHCDGEDGSTTFTDSSSTGHAVTANGNAQIGTSSKKFGTGSGLFDGTGDYLSISDSDGVADYWHMGTGNFTIDAWIKFDTDPASWATPLQYVCSQYNAATDYAGLYVYGWGAGEIYVGFKVYDANVQNVNASSHITGIQTNTWYHIAAVKSGTNLLLFWNGEYLGASAFAAAPNNDWPDLAGNLEVGALTAGNYFEGAIDEFRFSDVARWTSTFAPPNVAYRAPALNWITLSTRPLDGIIYYVSQANATASTQTVRCWTGSGFETLAYSDGTKTTNISLAQNGTISFDGTETIAKPMHFEGRYLYAYWTTLSAGSATIQQVTVSAPFQKMVDVWDQEIYQPCTGFHVRNQGSTQYTDYSAHINYTSNGTGSVVGGVLDALSTTRHVVITADNRLTALAITMCDDEENDNSAYPMIEYKGPSGWVSVGTVYDTTTFSDTNWITLARAGIIAWNPPSFGSEIPTYGFGYRSYAYRLTFSAALSASVTVDTVTTIPAGIEVPVATFPAMLGDRLLLCGIPSIGELNRIDYAASNTTEVWSGFDASSGGEQSIYIGGGEALTGAASLYNRQGSSLISALVLTKDTESYLLQGSAPSGDDPFRVQTVSTTIGCPAPLTIAPAEAGYEVANDINRNVVFWLSDSGPVLFDQAAIIPLPGIENYFDPNESECINFDAMETARGWWNSENKEYNLAFPSGSGQTTNNKWLVFDAVRKKWYEKVPPVYPACGFSVVDAYGKRYNYAGFSDGFMQRLEYGTTWDGTAIAQVIETGDFYPTKSLWDKTRLYRFKTAYETITEAATCSVTHYRETSSTGESLTDLDLDGGSYDVTRETQRMNALGWSHRLKWSASMSSTDKGFRPLAWGYQYQRVREDL